MTERELYLSAIEVLKRDGWCKEFLTNDRGQHCMLGAMDTAVNEAPFKAPLLFDLCGPSVTWFNDHCCQTINDAIAALEISADLAA